MIRTDEIAQQLNRYMAGYDCKVERKQDHSLTLLVTHLASDETLTIIGFCEEELESESSIRHMASALSKELA
ncbi:hypothetical protein [Pseudomonas sp. LRF_L74]|uniref:hypothetical protein n=1 Tax=Pseudomonas sp. LRF_L74 TaxID=3369422 RepID=UPI003F6398FA